MSEVEHLKKKHQAEEDETFFSGKAGSPKTLCHLMTVVSLGSGILGVLFFLTFGSKVQGQPVDSEKKAERKTTEPEEVKAPSTVVAAFNRGGCGGCHTIPGVPGADGQVGPDLSSLGAKAGSRRKGYSGTEYIRESIVDPGAFIAPCCPDGDCPSGVMLKAFADSLSDRDLENVVNYLATVGTDGTFSASETTETGMLSREIPEESVLKPFEPLPKEPASASQIALGKYLFFDRRLSGNNSLSCASCHRPEQAFSDGKKFSRGYPSTKLFRNTPSLMNVGFQREFFRDGRIGDLPSVVRDHLTEAHFMAMDGRLMVERFKQVPAYIDLFEDAYGQPPSFGNTLNVLTAYVRSLNTPSTPYDRFRKGNRDALSPEARAGLKLFRGKAGCVRCHPEPLLTDHKYHNLGVPEDLQLLADPERHLTFRRFFRVLGLTEYRNLREDVGRQAISLRNEDRGSFRTPNLREVGRTAPYMHNGRFAKLEEVVRFYNQGGGKGQRTGLKPLGLDEEEVSHLVAFLKSLSSPPKEISEPELPDYEVLKLGEGLSFPREVERKTRSASRQEPPSLAPLPEVSVPPDNPQTLEKVELGKLLFFDARMSADASISCNSCHASSTGWTIRTPVSMGGPGTSHWRNSQTILNVGYFGKLNWDGAKSSIEKQNAGAWGGAVAGNLDSVLAEERLAQIPGYVEHFREVFGTDYPTWEDALRAVAAFQRTIVSRDTPFDRFIQGNERAISESARRGYELFVGKADCIVCHNGPLASDDSFHALGVPQNSGFLESPLKQITFRFELASKGVPREVYEKANQDDGLYYVTKRPEDRGKFRTPTLRGLRHTAPYMHNGVFETLEEVVAFYNRGGGEHLNKSPLVQPLNLNEREQRDLVNFLLSLSAEPMEIEIPQLPEYGNYLSEEEEKVP